jgi:formylglycine-generating enzyme required for sulfatase activity
VNQRLLVSGTSREGEPTLSVAHEALFRVWDTLNAWLRKDRKALALRTQIEEAAAEWEASGRAESRQWPEARILDAVGEIRRSGVSLQDVARPEVVQAFLGPTDPEDLKPLPALGAEEDATAGSKVYGDAWRLPLGHEARASVGVRLAILGDCRPGVGLRPDGLPDIDWCRVEGGEVTIEIRANSADPSSEVVDRLTRTVEPFRIARYPVTITQFQRFLDECHREGRWRLPPGFPLEVPADYAPPKHRARHGNHPADSVNWWDAMLFCHWLGARLGHDELALRLPTELEWQCAAIGTDPREGDPKRVYPWGGDWDPRRETWLANTVESELNRSTAVGLYPRGASPADVLDMAGTVWEWCLNAFDNPDDIGMSVTDGDRRAAHGFRSRLHPPPARLAHPSARLRSSDASSPPPTPRRCRACRRAPRRWSRSCSPGPFYLRPTRCRSRGSWRGPCRRYRRYRRGLGVRTRSWCPRGRRTPTRPRSAVGSRCPSWRPASRRRPGHHSCRRR